MRWLPVAVGLMLLLLSSATVDVEADTAFPPSPLGFIKAYMPSSTNHSVADMDLSSESPWVVIATGSGGTQFWNTETRAARLLPAGTSLVQDTAVEVVGERVYVCDSTGRLRQVDPTAPKTMWTLSVLDGPVRVITTTDDGSLMAFLGIDADMFLSLTVIELRSRLEVPFWGDMITSPLREQTPTCAIWLEPGLVLGYDSRTLLIGTREGEIHAISEGSPTPRGRVMELGDPVVGMAMLAGTQRLIAAVDTGDIHDIDLVNGRSLSVMQTVFSSQLKLTCFALKGEVLAAGGSNGHIEVWNAWDRVRTQTIRFHSYACADVEWIDAHHLVSTNLYGKSVLWGPDFDSDFWADEIDVFPLDPTEWADGDRDGVGDNSDVFPLDRKEWRDSDNDGVGDNGDVFPKDPTEWKDTDGDGVGDNGDFLPRVHNTLGLGILLGAVTVAGVAPVARSYQRNRRRDRKAREDALAYAQELGLEPLPDVLVKEDRWRLDTLHAALVVRAAADPPMLRGTIEARDTTALNLMVALRVQDEVIDRAGVGADAAMARAVQLRDQLQELDSEGEQLNAIASSFHSVQLAVDELVKGSWPEMEHLDVDLLVHRKRVERLENSLVQFRRSSIIKIGEEATKVSRGAFVVAAREMGVKGSPRAVGVKVDVPPPPEVQVPEADEMAETTPMGVPAQLGRLRLRQALLLRDEEAELVISVDNTMPEDLEELAVELTIAGDSLRHKGPHRVELGRLVTGRSAAATFALKVMPLPDPGDEPEELTRLLARVSAMVGQRRLRQELPAKATTMVSSRIRRPPDWRFVPAEGGTVGRRGVRFPRVPSHFVLEALDYPQGLLPNMEGALPGGGTWRLFSSRTADDLPVVVAIGVTPGAEAVELVVEVRGPEGFPSREMAEELIDSVRFAVLSDRRLRLRGEDRPLRPARLEELADGMVEAYVGPARDAMDVGEDDLAGMP